MKWKPVAILLAVVVVVGGVFAGFAAANLTRQLNELEADHASLVSRVGDLETVEHAIATLEEELESLREERTPLVPQTHQVGFRPTGSMEPKITALDEAVWLDNYFPEDVIVGAVISFSPPPGHALFDPQEPLKRVSHRVIDIRVEDGVHYYRTKGDNNFDDDGWISSSGVHGYITELHKGVIDDPALVDLQSQILEVNPLKHLLWQQMNDLAEQHDRAVREYQDYIARYCPGHVCPSGSYERAKSLYDSAERIRVALDSKIGEYGSAVSQIESLREEMSRLLCEHL